MSVVVSFESYLPPARFDAVQWTDAQIEESDAVNGTWTIIDTVAITPDADPSQPAFQSFTTPNGTATGLWYRVSFLDGSLGISNPTTPVLNTAAGQPYADASELARILKIRTPSAQQTIAMERVLATATIEINSEIDLDTDTALTGGQIDLATEVCLERAVEHWRQEESPFGLIGLGAELGAAFTSKDSWERHALKLAPLKDQWGLA
jgi:hypothetical protein